MIFDLKNQADRYEGKGGVLRHSHLKIFLFAYSNSSTIQTMKLLVKKDGLDFPAEFP